MSDHLDSESGKQQFETNLKLTLNNLKVAAAVILSGTLFHSFGPLTANELS